ncbi:MAG: YcxB family protein [Rhodoblastus sp.]|nr:MAG: YcxB family protein [Rhodoblastus sp.]
MPPPWVTSFHLAREDVAALLKPRDRGIGEDLRWLLAAGLAAGVGLGAIEDEVKLSSLATLAMAAGIVAVVLLAGHGWRRWRLARAAAAWPLPAEIRVEIDHQAISLVEDGRARHVAWETALGVTRDASRVIVWMNPVADSVVLPLAAFEDKADMAAFEAFADARMRDEDEALPPPPEGPLSVEVTLTAEDARRVGAGAGRPLSYLQAMVGATLIGAIGLGGLALLVARGFGVEADMRNPWLWGALVGALAGAALLGHLFDRAQARSWRDWPTTTATLTIDADGLTRAADGVQTRVAWRAIDRVEERTHDLLLRTGAEAYVVPRRCFADEDGFDRFADAARAWRAAAASTAFAPAAGASR